MVNTALFRGVNTGSTPVRASGLRVGLVLIRPMTSPQLTPNLHQLHPFHLVTPSPSPLLTSFQLGALATLAVAFFQSTPSALANLLFALGVTALFIAV